MAQHKGFGTSLIVDVLSGILFGGATGSRAGDNQEGPGCMYIALNVDAFGRGDTFLAEMDARIDELKGSRLAPGSKGVFMPGEIEHNNAAEAQEMVWMMPEIVADLRALPK